MAIRIAVLGVVAVTIFCALFFRLWALQVISGERYLEGARTTRCGPFRAPAPRGSIVDRNGTVLVANVPARSVQLWPAALDGRFRTTRAHASSGSPACSTSRPGRSARIAARAPTTR